MRPSRSRLLATPATAQSASACRRRRSAASRVGRVADQLRQHGIVMDRHRSPVAKPVSIRVSAVGAGVRNSVSRPDRGGEIPSRILGVDAGLEGVAGERDGGLGDRQRFAGGHAQLPFHQVEPGDHFGDRVLDLQPGVHFQEEETVVRRRRIPPFLRRHSRPRFAAATAADPIWSRCAGRQSGRRGFLEHLLVAALRRTVALEQMHGVAVGVGEDLDLDMARPLQIALDQHAVVAERGCGLLPGGPKCGGEIAGGGHDPHAAPAAAGNRLDDDREADAGGLVGKEVGLLTLAVVTRQQRHGGFFHQRLGRGFRSHGAHRRGRRTDEDDPGVGAGLGEGGVLRQEAVSGMDRLGTGGAGGFDDPRDVQVAFARRGRPDRIGPVRRLARAARARRPPNRPRSFPYPCDGRCGRCGRRSRRGWR